MVCKHFGRQTGQFLHLWPSGLVVVVSSLLLLRVVVEGQRDEPGINCQPNSASYSVLPGWSSDKSSRPIVRVSRLADDWIDFPYSSHDVIGVSPCELGVEGHSGKTG
jgi:hypothetical protein